MEIYFLPLKKTNEADFIANSLAHIDYIEIFRLTTKLIAIRIDQNYDFYYEHPFSSLLEMLLSDGQISQIFFETSMASNNKFSTAILTSNIWFTIPLNFTATTFEQFVFPLASLSLIKEIICELLGETLIETITIFLKNNLNVLQTAKKMFVHRNTLNYRLSMIQQQTGINPRTFHGAVFFFTLLNT